MTVETKCSKCFTDGNPILVGFHENMSQKHSFKLHCGHGQRL